MLNSRYMLMIAAFALVWIIFTITKKYTLVPKTKKVPKKVKQETVEEASDEKDS